MDAAAPSALLLDFSDLRFEASPGAKRPGRAAGAATNLLGRCRPRAIPGNRRVRIFAIYCRCICPAAASSILGPPNPTIQFHHHHLQTMGARPGPDPANRSCRLLCGIVLGTCSVLLLALAGWLAGAAHTIDLHRRTNFAPTFFFRGGCRMAAATGAVPATVSGFFSATPKSIYICPWPGAFFGMGQARIVSLLEKEAGVRLYSRQGLMGEWARSAHRPFVVWAAPPCTRLAMSSATATQGLLCRATKVGWDRVRTGGSLKKSSRGSPPLWAARIELKPADVWGDPASSSCSALGRPSPSWCAGESRAVRKPRGLQDTYLTWFAPFHTFRCRSELPCSRSSRAGT